METTGVMAQYIIPMTAQLENYANEEIANKMEDVCKHFHFEKKDEAIEKLLQGTVMKKMTIIVRIEIST